MTLADLNAVAKKYIHPDKLAVLVVGNGPEIKPGLETLNLGPVQTIDITIPQPGGGRRAAAERRAVSKRKGDGQERIRSWPW